MSFVKNVRLISAVFVFSTMIVGIAVNAQTKGAAEPENGGMITLCHATGSKDNPFTTVTVKDNDVSHQNHPADINPAPAEGCPSGGPGNPPEPTPEPITVLLFGAGLAAAGLAARKFKTKGSSEAS